ncbi:TetR/AcrR family transcriptional regulator [Roseateles sp. SL47]|uniref:TetR/AcrR family transcriptional regulator n=1 Tax=Roseateles sp. SL47 TaxID=2995138 RepID=UPI0022721A13|nr:TetR/AcrR family transcriptional regulator [Roseateles sp. SL47]WAC70970.1 TetR/AcrR family transcriptional regulator [Roseateles sp. SL47]
MKTSKSRAKQASHERIMDAGARAIRREGYDAVSIARVMKEASLTHGGFYAHFDSREAMLVELTDRAGAESVAIFSRIAAAESPGGALRALLSAYLAPSHVEEPDAGCPIAALGSEMRRQAPVVRRAATRRIKEMIDLVARQADDLGQPEAHQRALTTMATLVGAVVLARAIDEPALSESVLQATRAHLQLEHALSSPEPSD